MHESRQNTDCPNLWSSDCIEQWAVSTLHLHFALKHSSESPLASHDCLNKDSILLALTSAIASLTGDDKEQHNYWIQWPYDWQFWAGLWTRYCWWSFSESGESRQSTRSETSWTICAHSLWQKRPVDWFECCWKNLSISLPNHYEDCVWRCQVCLPLCWWSNSWWCWDVETELADYFKNYLPGDVDFKDCCALRLPKSFLAS